MKNRSPGTIRTLRGDDLPLVSVRQQYLSIHGANMGADSQTIDISDDDHGLSIVERTWLSRPVTLYLEVYDTRLTTSFNGVPLGLAVFGSGLDLALS